MLLTCPHCDARYRVRLKVIPSRGVKATCTGCRTPFIVLPGADGRAAPPRAVAWLFSGDPATDELLAGPCRKALSKRFELRILTADDRVNAISALEDGLVSPPATLIFGDMHVILEEPLLEALGSWVRCNKVLVSTHHNDEMLANAKAFTGVDMHLTPPFNTTNIVSRFVALAA